MKTRRRQTIAFAEPIVGVHLLKGYEGAVCHRAQPGVYVPYQLMSIFMPKNGCAPATRVRVERLDDPDQHFIASVSRVGGDQCIVHVPIKHRIPDPRFPPDTACFVRIATDADEIE